MNAMRNTDTQSALQQEEPGHADEEGDSRTRLEALDSSAPHSAGSKLDEQSMPLRAKVAHAVYGRLRLTVSNLRYDFPQASACLVGLASKPGIKSVRCNSWCASAAIDYDPSVWTQDELIHYISELSYSLNAANTPVLPVPAIRVYKDTRLAHLVPIVRQVAVVVERIMPGWLQLGLSLASFGCAVFRVPLLVTRIVMALSVAPISCRAIRTLIDQKKAGIDALDGVAATLMLVNGRYVETGLMTSLIALGEFIREKTARRCEKLVTDLLGLSGRFAWLIRGDKRICIAADEVKVGEIVVVYPGDMVPVDGIVVSGEAAIDQSKLTGEAIPVEVLTGDTVFASTVNVEGQVYVRCQAAGSSTKAGMVLQCVTNAPIHATNIQNYASSLADKLIMPIFVSAGITFLITGDVGRLMSMLILDFCTGIRIAAPTAVLASMHRAGRRGILIKSGAALETMSSVTAIVFDKTGTLTSGEPKVEEVTRFNGHTADEVLAFAAAVEMRLHHPAARAIVKAAQERGLTIPDRDDQESEFKRGMGVKAIILESEVIVGSKNMMLSEGIAIDQARESEARATKLGESISYVAIDGKVAGLIRYADRLRPEVPKAMAQLKRMGVKKLVMATGDTEESAQKIAAYCGIKDVLSRAFPEDKADLVKRLKEQGHKVAVIGDGINDSPALAYADVAISLKGATEAARYGADVVLTDDNLARLPEAIRISRSAMGLVKQNLAMAIVPNALGFGMAGYGLLGPAGATVLNNGSAIAAALNSLRPLYSSNWSKAKPPKLVKQQSVAQKPADSLPGEKQMS